MKPQEIEIDFLDACELEDIEKAKSLFDQKLVLHKRKHYMLLEATKSGHLELVKYMVEKGAIIDSKGNGNSFDMACTCGHLEIVKYFVSKGYDIHSYSGYAFKNACISNQIEVAQYLFELGTDWNKFSHDVFINACVWENTDMLKHSVFEWNIQLTEKIEIKFPGKKQEIYRLFELRELNNKINSDLSDTTMTTNLRLKV